MEKTIPLSQIDIPHFDLRYYRSREFLLALAEDIRKHDLIVPIIVAPKGQRYLVLDGVNRVSAVRLLKRRTIKCEIINPKNPSEQLMIGLRVNYFRTSHDVMGIARLFKTLKEDHHIKQHDIAKAYHMSKSYVSKLIALNKLPEDKKLALSKGELDIRTAYNMVRKHRDPELMEKLTIKYSCDGCHGKFDLSHILPTNLCVDCIKKLHDLTQQEKERLRRERSQTGL